MIYTVIKYPKKIVAGKTNIMDFIIYAKQTSNKKIMTAYYNEQVARHGETCYVHLVSREHAQEIKKKWHDKIEQAEIAHFKASYNKAIARD